jgi:hypothetical protein
MLLSVSYNLSFSLVLRLVSPGRFASVSPSLIFSEKAKTCESDEIAFSKLSSSSAIISTHTTAKEEKVSGLEIPFVSLVPERILSFCHFEWSEKYRDVRLGCSEAIA